MGRTIHSAVAFFGSTLLAFFGIAFVLRAAGNGWLVAAGIGCLGVSILTWAAHRAAGEHGFMLRLGAASGNVLVFFMNLGWFDFSGAPEIVLASSTLLGTLAVNVVALFLRPEANAA